ncbi:homogentisate solanesyltransferase, chloroplastic-like [Morus notabilis]|uniref:homogentisate solanesyltransferase, chloroplastic-like n=1 Tax=Morus notabilis TaxID=981085 RepID=UPI000CED2E05|nr:homogentisate solanesyltransferase, chloroplastic-like [Morus notabilis]
MAKAEDESPGPDSVLAKVSHFVITSYNFLRPVSILQVIIANICLFASVLVENPQLFKLSVLLKAFPGLLAMIFANAYYAGINQIYDVDIDKVNKPYLPIAAGNLSVKQAWYLMIFYVLAGLLILWLMNADTITTSLYCFGLFLATFYSAPPFRFKISSLATAIVLPLNAGFIQILGILYTTRVSLGLPFLWSPQIVFFLTFVPVFYLVISFVKDIIDVEGDMKYNIRTFAAIFGPRITIFLGTGILLVNYIRAIALAIYMPQAFKLHIMVPAHSLLALWLIFEAKMAEKANYTKEALRDVLPWKLVEIEEMTTLFLIVLEVFATL